MTIKEIKYGEAFREQNRRATQKKRPFAKIYSNAKEDFELFETDEDQIKALMVDTGINFQDL